MDQAVNEAFDWDPGFTMGPESEAIARKVWPRFLHDQSDLPQPGVQFEIEIAEFHRRYPAWGLRSSLDKRLVAYTNAVLVAAPLDAPQLPDQGWQFAIEAGGRQTAPNCLCLVVANVDPAVQKLGLSRRLLDKAKSEARALGFSQVIAPVRPSHFHERRDLTFADYAHLRRDDGLLFDPWLRAHERAGAKLENICARSTVVTASVTKWEEWTGQTYPRSGEYPLAGGLAPLAIDLAGNLGTYTEPNVWMRYRI